MAQRRCGTFSIVQVYISISSATLCFYHLFNLHKFYWIKYHFTIFVDEENTHIYTTEYKSTNKTKTFKIITHVDLYLYHVKIQEISVTLPSTPHPLTLSHKVPQFSSYYSPRTKFFSGFESQAPEVWMACRDILYITPTTPTLGRGGGVYVP